VEWGCKLDFCCAIQAIEKSTVSKQQANGSVTLPFAGLLADLVNGQSFLVWFLKR
jgi:hypothetical protein